MMKYSQALRCLYYVGKCSKYLYYAKKALCVLFVVILSAIGISLVAGKKCGCRRLKELW